MQPIRVQKGQEFINRYGAFKHDNMIGKEFGSKMVSTNFKGFIYLLHPTPELWTLSLPHRTQILYLADISFITTYLDMKPGSRVIESGTGSGSFSHSIARAIAPTGKLYTFEYHADRAAQAAQEFKDHGLNDIIKLEHRDVCKDGFGLKDCANAVFLDLPAPWEAVGSAKEAFLQHRTGKICTFSPCIEQVSRTVEALNTHGFVDITMYECLVKSYDLQPIRKITFEEAIERAKQKLDILPKKRAADEDNNDWGTTVFVTKTPAETRGHTSYLTFATFLPAIESNISSSTTSKSEEPTATEELSSSSSEPTAETAPSSP
ncbi:tRNA methyltransferase complex GCD14 subunit-domain-containing protein [Dichotomocladium elegans]|nr:tRNA methyltransferase complex GCD14 subunit-domain-containing protein [Dichotomocladium elegans]